MRFDLHFLLFQLNYDYATDTSCSLQCPQDGSTCVEGFTSQWKLSIDGQTIFSGEEEAKN